MSVFAKESTNSRNSTKHTGTPEQVEWIEALVQTRPCTMIKTINASKLVGDNFNQSALRMTQC